jgi:cytochrome c5
MSFGLAAAELPPEVKRIFERRCYRCHGEEAKAGPRLDQPAVWDEDVAERVWLMVSGKGREIMPPDGKLSKAELKALKRWAAKGTARE